MTKIIRDGYAIYPEVYDFPQTTCITSTATTEITSERPRPNWLIRTDTLDDDRWTKTASSHGYVITPPEFITQIIDWITPVKVLKYGWWNIYRPKLVETLVVRRLDLANRQRRAQARADRLDKQRQKRRHFIQTLRKSYVNKRATNQ